MSVFLSERSMILTSLAHVIYNTAAPFFKSLFTYPSSKSSFSLGILCYIKSCDWFYQNSNFIPLIVLRTSRSQVKFFCVERCLVMQPAENLSMLLLMFNKQIYISGAVLYYLCWLYVGYHVGSMLATMVGRRRTF